jgi:hypothetical protein
MTLGLAAGRWLAEPGRSPSMAGVTLHCRGDAAPVAVPGPAGTGAGRLALPAPVNAHDHGYGIRTLDFGAGDDALEPWITGIAPLRDAHRRLAEIVRRHYESEG